MLVRMMMLRGEEDDVGNDNMEAEYDDIENMNLEEENWFLYYTAGHARICVIEIYIYILWIIFST